MVLGSIKAYLGRDEAGPIDSAPGIGARAMTLDSKVLGEESIVHGSGAIVVIVERVVCGQ